MVAHPRGGGGANGSRSRVTLCSRVVCVGGEACRYDAMAETRVLLSLSDFVKWNGVLHEACTVCVYHRSLAQAWAPLGRRSGLGAPAPSRRLCPSLGGAGWCVTRHRALGVGARTGDLWGRRSSCAMAESGAGGSETAGADAAACAAVCAEVARLCREGWPTSAVPTEWAAAGRGILHGLHGFPAVADVARALRAVLRAQGLDGVSVKGRRAARASSGPPAARAPFSTSPPA